MNNFNFGEVLTRAWQIIWKHKVLWIFGILASCARGGGGGGGNGGGGSRSYNSSGDFPFGGREAERFLERAGDFLQEHWWVILASAAAVLLLSFLLFALGMIGRIGVIKGTATAEKGAENLAFGELWSESLPYFWRLFGLNFLVGLAFLVIILPFVVMGVLTAGVGFICALPLICLLIPVGWAVSIIVEQAQAAIVLEDLGMMDGFKRGWEIVKSNPAPIVVMALILGVGGAIVGVIISAPILLAALPVVIGMNALRESMTPLWIALACCAAYMPLLLLLNGVLSAYLQSAWALTYMRLSQPAQPKDDAPI
ncbi:MAG: hypothetical protein LDL51_00185, partial [Chloroflexi bacterium]|nr:hypothetical protein [Chloroflexota bacterium]